MGLESIVSRYTYQLTNWNTRVFEELGVNYEIVTGEEIPEAKGHILVGSVLDAHNRGYYSLTQTANLVKLHQQGNITSTDVIFYEDMFTPGIEILPYIFAQVPMNKRPKVFVRCLAQTIDPDDFTNREGMFGFMRRYEQLVDSFVTGILCASEEMVANLKIAGFKSDLYVTGLPFGKAEVQERVTPTPFENRPKTVVFAARWDSEKQPKFFIEVAKLVKKKFGNSVKFVVLSGRKGINSNDLDLKTAAIEAIQDSTIEWKDGLSKNEYYTWLNNSRVLFNCALQDWVSNTVSEADALGCNTVFPAYRSFPEVFKSSREHLYIPFNVEDAALLIEKNIEQPQSDLGEVSSNQNLSIYKTVKIFQGVGKEYLRSNLDYRGKLYGAISKGD